MLFQHLCKSKLDWDSILEEDLLCWWQRLTEEFEAILQISIPRCYLDLEQHCIISQQLHGFSDALMQGYAAVLCLHTEYESGQVKMCLVSSKTRVAPMKTQTIPWLELLGTTILSRLVTCIRETPTLDHDTYCWTDSLTVLCWLKNNKQWKKYVKNRHRA